MPFFLPHRFGARARRMRRVGRFYLDRRICPACGATVYLFQRETFQRCKACRYIFTWCSEPEVVASRPPPPGSAPVLSVITDVDESEDESLRPRNSTTSDYGDSVSDYESSKTDPRGDSVVGLLDDQANEGQQPATPPVNLNPQDTATTLTTTAVPSTSPPPPRIQPMPTLRRPTIHSLQEPMAPTPSVVTAHAVRLPGFVTRMHSIILRNRLKAAAASRRARHRRPLPHPSPVIEPCEAAGVLQQHYADLYYALMPLGRMEEADGDEVEESEQSEDEEVEEAEEAEELSVSDTDEHTLVHPKQAGVNHSNEDRDTARSEKKKKKNKFLHSRVRKSACYKAMRALGTNLRTKTEKSD